MTDERMALIELVEKAADTDLLREMLAFAAERIMDAEAEMVACEERLAFMRPGCGAWVAAA
jgi:hypothetical protein